jgi:hypothetical protein
MTNFTPSNTMPGTYDLNLFPNLMRYRTPQANTNTNSSTSATLPCPPHSSVQQHPIELLSGDYWRRCPCCRRNKICIVIGRCIESGKRAKVVLP